MAKSKSLATTKPAHQAGAPRTAPAQNLSAIRERIDSIDQQLINLLAERAKMAVAVGRYKQANNLPIYAPARESQVLSRVLEHNKSAGGLLADRTIEGIYREIMSGSFALERPISIGYLGPEGSFSHVAAVRHFGSSVNFENLRDIAGVLTEVQRKHVDYGLLPVENSTMGGIAETLDALASLSEADRKTDGAKAKRTRDDGARRVRICAEVQLGVHHALAANCPPSKIKRIFTKPEVFSQCRMWLATQYPQAELISAASSSKAMQMVAEAGVSTDAAIGSSLAAELYGVNVLFPRIEDNPSNITRFVVLGRQDVGPSGDDKTTIMFSTLNKPGALVRVLGDFESAGVNLTHIDKRPSGRNNWTYTFFIDAEGHTSDKNIAAAIDKARRHCKELIVLGSFPASRQIL